MNLSSSTAFKSAYSASFGGSSLPDSEQKISRFVLAVRHSGNYRGGKFNDGYGNIPSNLEGDARKIFSDFYSEKELQEFNSLRGTEKDIEARMRVKISAHYLERAKLSKPIQNLVKPSIDETLDLSGEADPSSQNSFIFVPGFIHKYEMGLAYLSINCSAHCRYCYRSDLFSNISDKEQANIDEIVGYIVSFNARVRAQGERKNGAWFDKKTGERLHILSEVLLSGGDPMTLPNPTLARTLAKLAEVGIRTIRIGTKELAFNPKRFDEAFFEMLDKFHQQWPDVKLEIVGHYSHPHELVEITYDKNGDYSYDLDDSYQLLPDVASALENISARHRFLGHSNQFPIIRDVNDDARVVALIQKLCAQNSISMHNIYVAREIQGAKAFRSKKLHEIVEMVNISQQGLSGLESHGRVVMSTKYGKIQIVGAEREANQQVRLTMRSVRSPHDAETIGAVIEAVYPAQASVYWLDDLVDQNFITRDNSGVINCTNESSVMENIKREAGLEASEGHIKTRGIRVVAARSEVAVDIVGCAKSQCCKGKIGQTLADVTFAAGITENTCDQNLSCTSCAVLLPAQEAEKLPTPSAEEQDMIEQATEWFDLNQQQTKGMQLRLACQVRLSDDLAKKGLKIFELGAQG